MSDTDTVKYVGGFLVMIVGLIVITVLALRLPTGTESWKPSEIATVIGSLTTLLGSVVGAFLGVQIGSSGKAKVEEARDKAEDKASRALAALDPQIARAITG